jgi:hypothetical protein
LKLKEESIKNAEKRTLHNTVCHGGGGYNCLAVNTLGTHPVKVSLEVGNLDNIFNIENTSGDIELIAEAGTNGKFATKDIKYKTPREYSNIVVIFKAVDATPACNMAVTTNGSKVTSGTYTTFSLPNTTKNGENVVSYTGAAKIDYTMSLSMASVTKPIVAAATSVSSMNADATMSIYITFVTNSSLDLIAGETYGDTLTLTFSV